MTGRDFVEELTEVIADLPEELRREEEQQVDLIKQAGISSFEGLLAAVGNPVTPRALRLAGCDLLGRLGNVRAASVLVSVFNETTDDGLAWEAAKGLSLLETQEATEALMAFVDAHDATKGPAAAWALGRLGDMRVVPSLIEAVKDTRRDLQLRAYAAESLGVLRAKQATDVLIAALSDQAAEIRFWAAYALGQIGDAAALPVLERMADSDDAEVPDWGSVKDEAKDAIGQILSQQGESDT